MKVHNITEESPEQKEAMEEEKRMYVRLLSAHDFPSPHGGQCYHHVWRRRGLQI